MTRASGAVLLVLLVHSVPSQAQEAPPGAAVVTVTATKPNVTIGEVTGEIVRRHWSVVLSNSICQTPCQFTVAPGRYALIAHGPGYDSVQSVFDFHAGANRLQVDPAGSPPAWVVGGVVLLSLSIAAAVIAAPFMVHGATRSWALPTVFGGLGGVGVGAGMMILGRSTFDEIR